MSAAVMAHGGPNAANALAAQQPIHSHIPGGGGRRDTEPRPARPTPPSVRIYSTKRNPSSIRGA